MFFIGVRFASLGMRRLGQAEGLGITISTEAWEFLSREERISLIAHELRHVWQFMGVFVFALLGLLAPVFAIANIIEGLSSLAITATCLALFIWRWGYIGVRAAYSEEWAEMDADRFAFRISRKGTVGIYHRCGYFKEEVDQRQYALAAEWAKMRIGTDATHRDILQ